jgi:hypothetical protein
MCRPHFTPQKDGLSKPQSQSAAGRTRKFVRKKKKKKKMPSSVFKLATFWLIAQHLNQLHYCMYLALTHILGNGRILSHATCSWKTLHYAFPLVFTLLFNTNARAYPLSQKNPPGKCLMIMLQHAKLLSLNIINLTINMRVKKM